MDLSRRRLLSTSATAAAGLAGCAGGSANSETDPAADGTLPSTDGRGRTPSTKSASAVERLVRGHAAFGLDLLDHLATRNPSGNLFISPYSLEVAFGATYAGAAGRTRRQIAETFAFHPRGDALHPTFRTLRRRLGVADDDGTTSTPTSPTQTTSDGMVQRSETATPFTFVGANRLWGQRGFPWRDAFLRTVDRYYGAGLRAVDFASHHRRARRRINDWVAQRTRGTIPELLPRGSLSRRTRLVLTNAAYFEANWAEDFPDEATAPRSFTALDGSTSAVPTMVREGATLQYAAVDGHQLVALPYAGGAFSMVVVLPAAGEFEQFARGLTADRLFALFDRLEERKGTLRLPKFSFGSDLGLAETLSALGMPVAFDSDANFDPMGQGSAGDGLALDDVRHETFVSVDEEGTVASAATGVEVAFVSAHPSENPFEMTVDRPFLFVVRHDPTGLPVFLGRVADAAAARPS